MAVGNVDRGKFERRVTVAVPFDFAVDEGCRVAASDGFAVDGIVFCERETDARAAHYSDFYVWLLHSSPKVFLQFVELRQPRDSIR